MKYLITESQAKMVATFRKLDMKKFIQIDKGDKIYFVKSEDDEYAKIRYDKSDGRCYINYGLIKEISLFFSLQESDSKEVIGEWVENGINDRNRRTNGVENTLQMRVTKTEKIPLSLKVVLRIPFN
jgi:hypothetical protein